MPPNGEPMSYTPPTSPAARMAQLKGVEWAEMILADEGVLRAVTRAEFSSADADASGALDPNEARACMEKICKRFELALPPSSKTDELFVRSDSSGDGAVQLDEFGRYFRTLLAGCVRAARAGGVETAPRVDAEVDAPSPLGKAPGGKKKSRRGKKGGGPATPDASAGAAADDKGDVSPVAVSEADPPPRARLAPVEAAAAPVEAAADSLASAVKASAPPMTFIQIAQLKGIEWAESLLANNTVMAALCRAEFSAADTDHSGALDVSEARACVAKICKRFELPVPRNVKADELFVRSDSSGDGAVQLDEFGRYFRTLLAGCVRKARGGLEAEVQLTSRGPSPSDSAPDFLRPRTPEIGSMPSSMAASTVDLSSLGASPTKQLGTLSPAKASPTREVLVKAAQAPLGNLLERTHESIALSMQSLEEHTQVAQWAHEKGGPRAELVDVSHNEAGHGHEQAQASTVRAPFRSAGGPLGPKFSPPPDIPVGTVNIMATPPPIPIRAPERFAASPPSPTSSLASSLRSSVSRPVRYPAYPASRSRLVNRKLAEGFAKWSGFSARGRQLMLRTVKHYYHRHALAIGWNAWRYRRGTLAHTRAALLKSTSYWARHVLARGWNAWVEMADDRAAFFRKLRRALSYFATDKHLLARGLRPWREKRDARVRNRTLLRRGVGYLKNHLLARGWQAWRAARTERARNLAIARRCVNFLADFWLPRGWNAWRSWWSVRVRKLALVRRGVMHFTHARFARGWGSWLALHRSVGRKMMLVDRSAAYWFNHQIARGFNSWVGRSEFRATLRKKISHALSYLMKTTTYGAARGWYTWRAQWQARVLVAHKLRRGIMRMRNRNFAQAWSSWIDLQQDRSSKMALIRRSLVFLSQHQLARGWNSWCEQAAERAHSRMLLRSGLGRWRSGLLALGWTSWMTLHRKVERKLALLDSSASFWLGHTMGRGWNAWVDMVLLRAAFYRKLAHAATCIKGLRHVARGVSAFHHPCFLTAATYGLQLASTRVAHSGTRGGQWRRAAPARTRCCAAVWATCPTVSSRSATRAGTPSGHSAARRFSSCSCACGTSHAASSPSAGTRGTHGTRELRNKRARPAAIEWYAADELVLAFLMLPQVLSHDSRSRHARKVRHLLALARAHARLASLARLAAPSCHGEVAQGSQRPDEASRGTCSQELGRLHRCAHAQPRDDPPQPRLPLAAPARTWVELVARAEPGAQLHTHVAAPWRRQLARSPPRPRVE